MNVPRILIIDDEYGKNYEKRRTLCKICNIVEKEEEVNDKTVAIATFSSGQKRINGNKYQNMDLDEIANIVKTGWERYPRWALVFIDLFFDTGNFEDDKNLYGFEIVNKILGDENTKDIPIIILSSKDREAIERKISESGTFKYLKKPLTSKILKNELDEIGLIEDADAIGHSIAWLKCLREARKIALRGSDGRQENVLLIGETGTGKNILAKYIYNKSDRKEKGNYIHIKLTEIPYDLADDFIYGHIINAFEGAKTEREGAAELADRGVLFIDEIGDIPFDIQTKILQLIDKNVRTTQRIGTDKPKKVDLIVVAATNKENIIYDEKLFRSDIVGRLGKPIVLLPLKNRQEDIIPLAEHFILRYENEYDAYHRDITDEAKAIIEKYEWPKNTRELEDTIREAVYDYRYLKFLEARHLRLKNNEGKIEKDIKKEKIEIQEGKKDEIKTINEITNIMKKMSEKDFEVNRGDYARYEEADYILTVKMLRKALDITRKRGKKISYLEAIRYLINNNELKSDQARIIYNGIKGIGDKYYDYKKDPIFLEIEAQKKKKAKS